MQPRRQRQTVSVLTYQMASGHSARRSDSVAVEEPLEIKVSGQDGKTVSLATILRTPGHDFELMAGFLFSEGVIEHSRDIFQMSFCESRHTYQSATVRLRANLPANIVDRMRLVVTHGGCGMCSSRLLPDSRCAPVSALEPFEPQWLLGLPASLARQAEQFQLTGGTHAAGLLRPGGPIELLHEDVGRHNAVDKLIGQLFLQDALPATQRVLLLSGRAGFELIQKASRAGLAAVVSLGAPTTLSIDFARQQGIRLVGFLSEGRYNLYT